MGYNIKQMTKSSTTTYMTPMNNLSSTYHLILNPISSTTSFQDYSLKIIQLNDTHNYFKANEPYYIRGKILRPPQYYYSRWLINSYTYTNFNDTDGFHISVYLGRTSTIGTSAESEDPFQKIGEISIPPVPGDNEYFISSTDNVKIVKPYYVNFSLVFTPVSPNFDEIIFRVDRTTYDWIESLDPNNDRVRNVRDWFYDSSSSSSHIIKQINDSNTSYYQLISTGQKIVVLNSEDGDFGKLNNLISTSQTWKKFGFQGRPGTLLVVNGEPIRVGRSGIYEINNGTEIKSLCIASPGGNVDAFLLDYAYLD